MKLPEFCEEAKANEEAKSMIDDFRGHTCEECAWSVLRGLNPRGDLFICRKHRTEDSFLEIFLGNNACPEFIARNNKSQDNKT